MLTWLWEDLRFAARLLMRQPGFTAAAVVLLALGIGANSAIFSLVESVLLRPLPYKDLDRLHYIWLKDTVHGRPPTLFSVPEFADYDGKVSGFEEMGGLLYQPMTVTQGQEAVRVMGAFASRRYFETLGIPLRKGRLFHSEEFEPGKNQAVILTDGFWRRHFGGDPSVLGSTMRIESEVHVIAGILPALEGENRPADIYMPLPYTAELMGARDSRTMMVVARLKPGVTKVQADAELRSISQRVAGEHPASNRGLEAFLRPAMEEVRGTAGQPLGVLAAAVGVVLLVACANLASLLLVRASGRMKEIAIRSAMGASQGRIFRQMITESVLLALVGGAAGLVLAAWCVKAVKAWGVLALPRLELAEIGGSVLLFNFLLSLAAGVLFGSAPAWQALRLSLAKTLNEESRGSSGGKSRGLTRSVLVVAEVALSVILLVSAGLLLRTYAGLARIDMGFQPERVLTMRTALPTMRYVDDESRALYVRRVISRLQTLPGVAAAGGAALLPMMTANWLCQFSVEGSGASSPESANYNAITPGYFETIGAKLVAGRVFNEADTAASEPVVIVSRELAARYFPKQDPLGRTLTLSLIGKKLRVTIVGVVRDMAQRRPEEPPRTVIYQPHAQRPWPFFQFTVRSVGTDPMALLGSVRQALQEIDAELPVDRVQTLDAMVERVLSQQKLAMALLTAFAALAVLLAAVGLYGVLAVAVSQRSREFGIRAAMGAGGTDILRHVFKQGMGLTLAGLAAGLAAAPLASYAFQQMLYGVTFVDPWTYAATAGLMLAVSAAACVFPALRAARVDPARALRE